MILNEEENEKYIFLSTTPRQFLERRIAVLFGVNSMAMKALDLVCCQMSANKGYTRDDGQDYFNHCIDVANTLISFYIRNEDVICAALLHDIVEDVDGFTKKVLSQMFNENVANLVMMVTKDPNINYKKDGNLEKYIKNISKNPYASVIKTADRMHNMMTLQERSLESRNKKAIETEIYYLPFFKYCRKTYPRYENLFYAARSQTEPLIFEIKAFYKENEDLKRENIMLKKENELLKKKLDIKS